MNINEILKLNNFEFKKKYGQNFILDSNLLSSIVSIAQVTSSDEVLEIGVGAGTLTQILAQNAQKVVGVEIDKHLEPVVSQVLKEQKNVFIVYDDFLKLKSNYINSLFAKQFKVVANLPYYITSPIIFKFLEEPINADSLTLMVQKEVADRLVANQKTKLYGAITVQLNSVADVSVKKIIDRKCFYPVPNVDSAVVLIKLNLNKFKIDNLPLHKKIIKNAFSMRRKTLVNCLKSKMNIGLSVLEPFFTANNLSNLVRGEALSVEQFVKLSNYVNEVM